MLYIIYFIYVYNVYIYMNMKHNYLENILHISICLKLTTICECEIIFPFYRWEF